MLRNLFLFLFIAHTQNSFAFKLTPIVQEFGFNKKERTKSFRVINTNKEAIKIEAATYTRSIDKDGNEKRAESEDFMIYPPLFEVAAGKSQVIRVSYIGKEVDKEVPYRMIVRQVPGAINDGVQLKVVLEYIASLYVTPKNVSPKIEVNKAYVLNNKLHINLENSGKKHDLLHNYDLSINQKALKKKLNLKDKQFKKWSSINLLPGNKRELIIPFEEKKFEDGKVEVNLIKD